MTTAGYIGIAFLILAALCFCKTPVQAWLDERIEKENRARWAEEAMIEEERLAGRMLDYERKTPTEDWEQKIWK